MKINALHCFLLFVAYFLITIDSKAQLSPDSLNPSIVLSSSVCIESAQCRFVENEANCFLRYNAVNNYLRIETSYNSDSSDVNISELYIYKITPSGNELILFHDYEEDFLTEFELTGIEAGENYLVNLKRTQFKPCDGCESTSQRFSFCLLDVPKSQECIGGESSDDCQLVCNSIFANVRACVQCFSNITAYQWDFVQTGLTELAANGTQVVTSPDVFAAENSSSNCYDGCTPSSGWCYDGTNPISWDNYMGYQEPVSGNNYAGFIAYSASHSWTTPEKISGKLKDPMVAGQKYYVKFYVSLGEKSNYAVKNIGIHFYRKYHPTTNPIHELAQNNGQLHQLFSNGQLANYTITPQNIKGVINNTLITETTDWVEISGEYIASGNEDGFIITNFSPRNDPEAQFVGNNNLCREVAYYYVDAISVRTEPTVVNIEVSECGPNGYTLTASDGFDTYLWSTGETTQSITVNPLSPTLYSVTGSNSNSGCVSIIREITLRPINVPNIEIIGTEFACEHNGTSSFLATNYNPLYTYNWSISGNASGTVTTNPNLYEVQFGDISSDYTVNLHVVTDQGCDFYYSTEVKGCCSNVNLDCVGFDEGPLYSNIPTLDYKVNYTASRLIFENGGNTTIQGSPSGSPIMSFQGDLIIDTDITFQGRFMFSQNTGIIVEDGVEFTTLSGSHLMPCDCNDEMWNGILLEAHDSKLSMTGTRIYQAKAGVTSIDGAEYTISGSTFRNCYKGLVVNEYPSSHTGLITNTVVSSKIGDLIAPYAGNNSKTAVAIEVNNVQNIEIGINNNNFPFTSLGGVRVKNARNGFVFTNSNVIVRNSILEDCYVTAGTPTIFSEGHGMLSISNDGNVHSLTVEGTNQYEYTTFEECNIGLMTMGDIDLYVKGNRFNSIYKLAGMISFGNSANIDVFNNKLNFGGTTLGIYLWNVPNVTANINNNQINYAAGYPGGNSAGIAAETFGTVPADINIFSNQIKNCFSGIYVNNIPETEIYNNTISLYIDQNSVNNSAIELNGISVSNATEVSVKNNNVRRFLGTPNSDDNLNGIRVENCAQALVQQNTIRSFGKGINVLESNPNALFYCNTLQFSYDGFSFLNAEIGNQGFIIGNVKMPQNNRWLNNINLKLTGDLTTGPIDWVYKNGAPFSPSPQNVFITPNYQLATGGGMLEPCLYLGGGGPKKLREDLLGKIVRNEKSFQVAEDEFQLSNRNYALKKLLQDTSLLYLGEPDDVDYQDFVSTYQNATVGSMCEIDKLIQQKDYAQALAETSNLTNHTICENIKTTHQIFHDTWANEWYQFSTGQIDTLQEIACQSGLMAGKSVYDARALLGWFNNCDNLSLNKSMGIAFGDENTKDDAIGIIYNINVYPNPSKGIITIEYDNLAMNADVYVYSLTGAIVKQFTLQNESNNTSINMTDLTPGIYFLSIKKESEQLFNEKIVITK